MTETGRLVKFWSARAIQWEKRRYDAWLSNKLYSSLRHRRDFLVYLVEQLPPGARVVELGCGSGRLFGLLRNRDLLHYTGYDISGSAIAEAKRKWKDFPNSVWIESDLSQVKELKADLVISAGLLDWLGDEQIRSVIKAGAGSFYIHSFSTNESSLKTKIHKIFSFFQSFIFKTKYSPRKFQPAQITNLFGSAAKIVKHRDLSFGAFVFSLPAELNADFQQYKIKSYFNEKPQKAGLFEAFVKKCEADEISKKLARLTNLRVLEVGSGTGFYTRLLLNSDAAAITCIDSAVDTSRFVNSRQIRHLNTRLENVTLTDKFDLILIFGVLEFVTDRVQFVDKIRQVAAKNARVLVLYPSKSGIVSCGYRLFHKLGGRQIAVVEPDALKILFSAAGFTLENNWSAGPLNNLFEFKKAE
jgi:SAM-dependent methyltransferase